MRAHAAEDLARAYRVVSPARKPAVPRQGRGRLRTPPRRRRRNIDRSVAAPLPPKEPTLSPVPFLVLQCNRLRDLALEAARLERRHRQCVLESDDDASVDQEDPSLELVRLRARCLSLEEMIRAGQVGGGEPRSVALVTRAELARAYALGGMGTQALEHADMALEQHSALASRDGYDTVEEEASTTKLEPVRAALRALSQLRDAFFRAKVVDNTSTHPTARADDGDALVAGTAIYTELHALVAAYNHSGVTSGAAELGALLRPSFAAVEMLRAPASALTWAGLAAHIRRWVPTFNALGQTLEDALWLHRTATLRCVFYEAATLEAQRAAASERATGVAVAPANVDSVGARISVLRDVARADSEIATFLRLRTPPGAPPGGDRFAYDLGAALQDAGVTRIPWEDVLAWAVDGRVVSDALGALHAQMLLTAACGRIALADTRAAAAGAGSRSTRRHGAAARSSSAERAKKTSAGDANATASSMASSSTTKKKGRKKSKGKSKGKRAKAKASATRRAAKAASARVARDAELGEARLLLRDAESALCGLIGVGAGDAAGHLALCGVWASRGRAALAAGPAGLPAALECQQLIVGAKRSVLGEGNLETARAQRALGEMLALLGDDAAALDALDAALDARRGAPSAAPPTALALRVFTLRCAAIEASAAEADGDAGDGGNDVLAAPPTAALREAARSEWRAGDEASREAARSVLRDAATALQRLDGYALGVHDAAAELLQLLVEYDEGVDLASAHEWLGSALIAAAEEQSAAGTGCESGTENSFSTKGWSHLAKAKALFVDELGPGHARVRTLEERLATFQ